MRDQFNHILLTRFNVRIRWAYTFRGCDPDWLAERFQLFDRYCFPSVVAQTNTNFVWLVFFDAKTPEPYRSSLRRYEQFEPFQPIFVREFGRDVLLETLAGLGYLDRPFLITSRLDNDDALAWDYIDRVQQAFTPQERTFVNFPTGLVLCDGALFQGRDPHSHFVSLIERSHSPLTVYVDHTRINDYGFVLQIDGPPAWLEVRHPGRLTDKGISPSWQPIRRKDVAHLFPTIGEFQSVPWLGDNLSYALQTIAQLFRRFKRRLRGIITTHVRSRKL